MEMGNKTKDPLFDGRKPSAAESFRAAAGFFLEADRLHRNAATAQRQCPVKRVARRRTSAGTSPRTPGGITLRHPTARLEGYILRVYQNIGKHRVIALAAGVAFYALLAIFPAIAALVAIYGFFADPATISSNLDSVAGLLPGGAIDVIRDQMTRIASHGRSTLGLTFAVGLGVSLWSANAGLKALIDAINLVYNEEEKRGFIKLNLMSLTFTLLTIIFALFSIAAIAVVPVVLAYVGLGDVTATLVKYGRWPILFVVVAAGLAALYRYGPSRSRPKWRWITWGSAVAAVAWMIVSLLFSW
jgi:membrane protein